MKVVVAPDKFKGSLSAPEAARAMARGVARGRPDGRRSTRSRWPTAARGRSRPSSRRPAARSARPTVTGPLGEPVRAPFGLLGDGRTAVIEMAAASGLVLVPPRPARPAGGPRPGGRASCSWRRSTPGRRRVIVGIGGSATNDGGAGLGQALGFRLLDARGPRARARRRRARPARPDRRRRARPAARRASRSPSPATSTTRSAARAGASAVYGPQKGADPAMVAALDRNLAHFAADRRARPRRRRSATSPARARRGASAAGLVAFAGGPARAGRRAGHRRRRPGRPAPRRRPLPDRRRGDRRLERLRQDGRRRRPARPLARLPDARPGRHDRPGRRGGPRPRGSTPTSASAPARSRSTRPSPAPPSCSNAPPTQAVRAFLAGRRERGQDR